MLLEILAAKRLVVILDGIDEATGLKDRMQTLIKSLAYLGVPVLATSRPEGVPDHLTEEQYMQRKRILEARGNNPSLPSPKLPLTPLKQLERAGFLIFDLAPLTNSQIRAAIDQQLYGSEFFSHLFRFGEIRKEHDRIYTEVAVPDSEDRHILEQLGKIDQMTLSDGRPNADMRQRNFAGSIVHELELGASPQSRYLKDLRQHDWADGTLSALDGIDNELTAPQNFPEQLTNVNCRLMKLAKKLGERPSALAAMIVARTDQIYLAHEAVEEWVELALQTLVEKVANVEFAVILEGLDDAPKGQIRQYKCIEEATIALGTTAEQLEACAKGGYELTVVNTKGDLSRYSVTRHPSMTVSVDYAPFKDPVRVFEKASDDYAVRFNDSELAESNVLDVKRGRVLFSSGADLTKVLSSLCLPGETFDFDLEAPVPEESGISGNGRQCAEDQTKHCTIELIRVKNKFRIDKLDPTRFRNILVNVRVTVEGYPAPVFAEIQLHHKKIFRYNEESKAHTAYEYFRSQSKIRGGIELDVLLERAITFMLNEVCTTPVLLSLLIVVARRANADNEQQHGLPVNLCELYDQAINALASRDGLENAMNSRGTAIVTPFPAPLESPEIDSTSPTTVLRVLRKIATDNMRPFEFGEGLRREFTLQNVDAALDNPVERRCWRMLMAGGETPLIKVLEDGSFIQRSVTGAPVSMADTVLQSIVVKAASEKFQRALVRDDCVVERSKSFAEQVLNLRLYQTGGAVYQFRHLSIQEALFASDIIGQDDASMFHTSHEDFLKLVLGESGDAALGNAARIGGWDLGRAVGRGQCQSQGTLGIARDFINAAAGFLSVNTSVTEINLSSEEIRTVGAAVLAEALKVNTTVVKINLADNKIGGAGAAHLAEALKINKAINNIDLDGNETRDAGMAMLAEALKFNRALTEISLADNKSSIAGTAVLAETLKVNAVLEKIDLGRNHVGDAGTALLAEALKANVVLSMINLSSNKIGDAGMTALAEALKVNTALTVIGLYKNQIGDVGMAALAEALRVNKAVKEIELALNQIGDTGINAFTEALKINTTLTQISLNQNQIGDVGVAVLSEALKINTTLTQISLGQNQIGNTGVTALAGALKVNTALTVINLRTNQIGDAGMTALAGALKVNTALTAITLSQNQIGHAGITALAEVLKVNIALTEIFLYQNQIGDAGTAVLFEALRVNTALKKIDLGGNNMDREGIIFRRDKRVHNSY